jgi:hypothetical protein
MEIIKLNVKKKIKKKTIKKKEGEMMVWPMETDRVHLAYLERKFFKKIKTTKLYNAEQTN